MSFATLIVRARLLFAFGTLPGLMSATGAVDSFHLSSRTRSITNLAVTQMDQTTQQNAALVEEAAAASLREQAAALSRAVVAFRVDGAAAA